VESIVVLWCSAYRRHLALPCLEKLTRSHPWCCGALLTGDTSIALQRLLPLPTCLEKLTRIRQHFGTCELIRLGIMTHNA
jgi:hypothetical protein